MIEQYLGEIVAAVAGISGLIVALSGRRKQKSDAASLTLDMYMRAVERISALESAQATLLDRLAQLETYIKSHDLPVPAHG